MRPECASGEVDEDYEEEGPDPEVDDVELPQSEGRRVYVEYQRVRLDVLGEQLRVCTPYFVFQDVLSCPGGPEFEEANQKKRFGRKCFQVLKRFSCLHRLVPTVVEP